MSPENRGLLKSSSPAVSLLPELAEEVEKRFGADFAGAVADCLTAQGVVGALDLRHVNGELLDAHARDESLKAMQIGKLKDWILTAAQVTANDTPPLVHPFLAAKATPPKSRPPPVRQISLNPLTSCNWPAKHEEAK